MDQLELEIFSWLDKKKAAELMLERDAREARPADPRKLTKVLYSATGELACGAVPTQDWIEKRSQ